MRTRLVAAQWEQLAEAALYRTGQLAKLRKISTRQLRRQFRREFGRSPKDWLDERRMLIAERLLLKGESIKFVTFELGFKQTSHFCRLFKSIKRMTPSEFVMLQNQLTPPMSGEDNKCPEEIMEQR